MSSSIEVIAENINVPQIRSPINMKQFLKKIVLSNLENKEKDM